MFKDIVELKNKFTKFDENNNLNIDLAEFVNHFPDMFGKGAHSSRLFKNMDIKKKGNIGFNEVMYVLYPLASKKIINLTTNLIYNLNLNKNIILELKLLFKKLNDYYKLYTYDYNIIPLEITFALMCNSKSFFPFTTHIRNKYINNFKNIIKCNNLKCVTIKQFLHILFDKTKYQTNIDIYLNIIQQNNIKNTTVNI